ncbi:unnamed protein product [Penicillium olsonii]|nr:unnamed protein product [Penicillium olsonii]
MSLTRESGVNCPGDALKSSKLPRLAAISYFYDFYYSVIKDGMFLWQIERLHDQYGPIVRITPREIHIKDSSFYHMIYAGNHRRTDTDQYFVQFAGAPYSMLGTSDHHAHQCRRKVLSRYFSKRAIARAQPLIQETIEAALKNLKQACEQGTIVNLRQLSAALTAETICHYSYGHTFSFLENGSGNILSKSVQTLSSFANLLRFLPFNLSRLKNVPFGFVERLFPGAAAILRLHKRISADALKVLRGGTSYGNPSIFHALSDPSLPAGERTLARLEDEGFVILSAGTETTPHALSVTMFYLLSDKVLLSQLQDEVRGVMPLHATIPPLSDLENLPLLRACINEGLRLSIGTLSRHPRIAPDTVLEYEGYTIPAGVSILFNSLSLAILLAILSSAADFGRLTFRQTPVGQAQYFVHMDPEIYPNPRTFNPWRWLEASKQGVHLESMLVPFTKGSRQCLGIHLAYAEIYLVVANLINRVDMHLVDTNLDHVSPHRDRILVQPRDQSGVKVIVTKIL